MKKRLLLLTTIAGFSALVLTSGKNGAGFQKGYNSTGSETGLGNVNGCNAGSTGCHGAGATAGITIGLELDSAGVPQTYYTPGGVYTIKLTGTNTTSTPYPKFGFQVSAIKGSTSVVTPVNAGTFQTTGLPTGVRFTAPTVNFVCSLVEHSSVLPATTLGGATGGTYVVSFNWTAPVAGTGTVSIWSALNAANGDTLSAGDKWNTKKLVLSEGIHSLNVSEESADVTLSAFPNPCTDLLNIRVSAASNASCSIRAYDLGGRAVYSGTAQNGSNSINTAAWAPGIYKVVITSASDCKAISVVKQ